MPGRKNRVRRVSQHNVENRPQLLSGFVVGEGDRSKPVHLDLYQRVRLLFVVAAPADPARLQKYGPGFPLLEDLEQRLRPPPCRQIFRLPFLMEKAGNVGYILHRHPQIPPCLQGGAERSRKLVPCVDPLRP